MESPPPPGIDEREAIRALAETWAIEVAGLRYELKGFGSHHWVGDSSDGRRWFVKLDGLEDKPYLGDDPTSARRGLEAAYGTAHRLERAGLAFVVAPVPTLGGQILLPVGEAWTLSVFPFVDGATGEWGRGGPVEQRRRLVRTLAELHGVTPGAEWSTPRRSWELPGRAALEAALAEVGGTWTGGPYSGAARQVLKEHLSLIRGWLARLDSVASDIAAAGHHLVVTHGEPHPGNVMTAGGDLRVIDWDTVALGPAERDLWMFDNDVEALRAYERASGHAIDPTAMSFYRLTWALSDVAAFIAALRRPHARNRVTEKSWSGLVSILDGSEPAPYGGGRVGPR